MSRSTAATPKVSRVRSSTASRGSLLWPAILLAIATFLFFSPVLKNDFVGFDDPIYITENPHLQKGLTTESIAWAFTTSYANFWHPMTWLSHLLDVEMHGLKPSGHHGTALLLHLLNTLLLFWILQRMTGATWRSAFVAALFSLHPLHVESVAWASERKDLLSTFFWMLTTVAYLRYVEARTQPSKAGASRWYAVALLFFALGLMAKPMLVTLPFVLLLLDFWPLQRIAGGRWQVSAECREPKSAVAQQGIVPLIMEKVPFLALAIAAAGVAFWAQKTGGAIATSESLPLQTRIINAFLSYERYLWKTLVPTNLAIPYPYHTDWSTAEIAMAVLLLIAFSAGAFFVARRRPHLFVGWFWYVGTLVPVIGLVQVASAPMADRYTYIPLIGIFLAVTWMAMAWARRVPNGVVWLGTAAIAVLGLCGMASARQLGHWRNSETLFSHAVRVTRGNQMAQYNLGRVYSGSGRMDDAILAYEQALEMKPDALEPRINLASVLGTVGRLPEAIAHLETALKSHPESPDVHYNLGLARAAMGRMDEAVAHYEKCLSLAPDDLRALNNLGWIRAANPRPELRNGAEAVRMAQKACEQTNFQDPRCLGVLAAAYAEVGDFNAASETAAKARDIYRASNQEQMALRLQERVDAYRAGQPARFN